MVPGGRSSTTSQGSPRARWPGRTERAAAIWPGRNGDGLAASWRATRSGRRAAGLPTAWLSGNRAPRTCIQAAAPSGRGPGRLSRQRAGVGRATRGLWRRRRRGTQSRHACGNRRCARASPRWGRARIEQGQPDRPRGRAAPAVPQQRGRREARRGAEGAASAPQRRDAAAVVKGAQRREADRARLSHSAGGRRSSQAARRPRRRGQRQSRQFHLAISACARVPGAGPCGHRR